MSVQSYLDHLINILNEKSNYYYLIRHRKHQPREWFLMDVESTTPVKVIWVPSLRSAYRFSTEEVVEDFKAHWLKGRTVDILRMKKH